jgi:hypothetical protein
MRLVMDNKVGDSALWLAPTEPLYRGAVIALQQQAPSRYSPMSPLTPPILKRYATLSGVVYLVAPVLADGELPVVRAIVSAHINHQVSLTESQEDADPNLQSC